MKVIGGDDADGVRSEEDDPGSAGAARKQLTSG